MESESARMAVELSRRALLVSLELALPVLLVGLIVGFLVSIFQALTQIQEQTLAFVPRILAIAAVLFVLMPWMLAVMADFTREMFTGLGIVLVP